MAALAGASPDTLKAKMLEGLDGKSGAQVIERADGILAERGAKERTQALAEIQELEAQEAAAEVARKELAKFEVSRSRFYKQAPNFGMTQPTLELSVKNGTGHPISRAYFVGTLASPGRSVPWLKEDFNYSIPGGLEPGELADWTLVPNSFGAWGTVEAPKDAILTVEVVRLDGPNAQALLDSKFDESKVERLSALKKKVLAVALSDPAGEARVQQASQETWEVPLVGDMRRAA